jgi:hypothetical protein
VGEGAGFGFRQHFVLGWVGEPTLDDPAVGLAAGLLVQPDVLKRGLAVVGRFRLMRIDNEIEL